MKSDNNQNIISFSNFAKINPFRKIPNGKEVKFVSMEDVEAGRKFVTRYSIREFKGGSKFRNGDTLMARITPSLEHGKTAFVKFLNEGEVGGGSTEFIVLSNREGVSLSEYVYYLAISSIIREPAIKSMSGTSGRQRVDPDIFEQIQVPAPDLDEQQAIVKILSDLDEKIELNNQMNKTLEDIEQAIFKRWFVDFEFPNENGKPYKSSGGEMVESELGMIPKGWEVQKLGDLISLDKGLSYKGKFLAQEGDGNVLINLGCIKPGGGFLSNGIKYYNGKFNKNHIVRSGDVVVANTDITQKREILGSPVIIPNRFSKNIILFTHHLYAMRLSNKEELSFVFFLMQTQRYRDQVTSYATGTTVLAIPKEAILDFKFVFPDINVLRKFNDLSQLIFNEINLISETNLLIEKIRDLLLPKLMTGKIRVPLEEQNVQ